MIYNNILFFIFFFSISVHAGDFDFGWSEPALFPNGYYEQKISQKTNNYSGLQKLIHNYRDNESPWRGTHCPCFPTCSAFMQYSISEYGLIKGFIMGMDRLYCRENMTLLRGDGFYFDIERGDEFDEDQRSGVYDPPEANNIFIEKDWRIVTPYFYFIRERNKMPNN